ncbi:neurogenic locus notch homolog protein 3-like [Phoenix dactylifera]|uniref:Neurogenic locus notch homolog protein 3-like n=1 Tax=Phoenix dactylifera TaxID=42345 RepID=A0A8B7CYW1_PHODC|nr:neurogenic locus notch homolog protein 3-like [Phoenix dactylifera]XP_038978578.1 neurogenic locus notch homolog protein 3-like [Phoenix dactylifera]
MGWVKVALVLVALQAPTFLLPQRAAAGDFLAPFLSPVLNATCANVDCGKGTCNASFDHTFGFVCECKPGWSQFHIGDSFRFSPCVIPNCSINYSCYNHSEAPAPSPPTPSNSSMFDPCFGSYCGGGTCVKTSSFDHRCECKEGFSNLLNETRFPCYRDCSLGADCANLGITLPNATTPSSPPSLSTPSSPPSLSDNGSSFAGDSFAPNNLLWLLVLMISFSMVRAT